MADRAAGQPADATTAASAAIHAAKGRLWDGVVDPDALARVVLEAAGPVIAAEAARQERQRIRQLAITRNALYDAPCDCDRPGCCRTQDRPFADLLGGDAP